jgi:hemoglobin/transferrin/lactoferrin receptor protein
LAGLGWPNVAIAQEFSGVKDVPQPLTTAQALVEEEEEITITGTRTPRTVRLSPTTVKVLDRETLDQTQSKDLREMTRYEPNVSVGSNRRYGLQDVIIRGLGGNRVLLQTDGIRLPTQFTFGTPAIGRDYVELDALQRVEILKGSASALYGSDALAGVVTFRTVNPADVLGKLNAVTSLGTSYDSADNGFVSSGLTAARFGNLEMLLGLTRRDAAEVRVPRGQDFVDNKDLDRTNYLGKLVYRLGENSSITFTGERFENFDQFQVSPITVSGLIGPTGFRGQDESLTNETSRTRFSLGYDFTNENDPGWLSAAKLNVYYQRSENREERAQDFTRTGAGTDRRRLRQLSNEFTDAAIGGELQLQSQFKLGNVNNRLSYGFELSSTDNSRTRDGIERRLNATGLPITTTSQIGADNFPVKDFPDSKTTRFGVYLQDEIDFGNRLTLIPGLRFDSYNLTTSPDALYARNPGAVSADLSAAALSPSVGLVYNLSPELAIVGRYARGFRAPLYSEINAGFTNLTSPSFRYKTLSNPDLEPESSNNFELGLRGGYKQLDFSLTGFYNRYQNFIERFANVGTTTTLVPGSSVTLFQSRNAADAQIYGLELSGQYRFDPDGTGFSLIGSAGWTVGDNLTTDRPLEEVQPFKAVAGLRYRGAEKRWGADLIATFVAEPRLADNRVNNAFTPKPYTVLDLVGFYHISPSTTFNLGVYNLTNARYFDYQDVRTLVNAPAPFDIDRFAQPGISVRTGLNFKF